MHRANLSTATFLSTLTFNGGSAAPYNNFGQNTVDEAGNLYVPDQGNVLGGNPFASLLRVPAGSSEFDLSYEFNIAQVANPGNIFLSLFRGFFYYQNNIAFALVAVETPQELIDLVNSVGGPQNLSMDDRQQALDILFRAENGRWSIVDVQAQTVTPIDNVPSLSPFAGDFITIINGKIYFAVTTPTINAMYSYDPATGQAEKAFDVTGGALIGVYNLSRNN